MTRTELLRGELGFDVLEVTDAMVMRAIAASADVPATLRALAEALTGRAGSPGSLPARLTVPAEVA
jgi:beta-glucosidase-like glycosyl hydrolase